MGIDDVVEDVKEDQAQQEIGELKDGLGIEDKEELEEYDDRLHTLAKTVIAHDKKIEQLDREIAVLREALLESVKLSPDNQPNKTDGTDKTEDSDNGELLWE